MLEAKRIAQEDGIDNFAGSRGWLYNFLCRHDYSLRRINSTGKDLPKDISANIQKFHNKCQEKREKYTRSQIYNWDESFVQLDSPASYTYDKKGISKVRVKTTGQEKTKLSFGLCAAANGDKLEPVFVLPRKRKLKD